MNRLFFYGGPEHLTEKVTEFKPEPVFNVAILEPLSFSYLEYEKAIKSGKNLEVKTHQYYLMREIRLINHDTLYFYISQDVYGRY